MVYKIITSLCIKCILIEKKGEISLFMLKLNTFNGFKTPQVETDVIFFVLHEVTKDVSVRTNLVTQ